MKKKTIVSKIFANRQKKISQIDSDENSFERCVLCGAVTDVPFQQPVSERKCYVPGAGQLCEKCCIDLYGTDDLSINAESEFCKI